MNPLIVDFVEDYADLLFNLFGNQVCTRIPSSISSSIFHLDEANNILIVLTQVKWWITINEPTSIVLGYAKSFYAPGLNLTSSVNYIVGHNILRAHGRVYRLYEAKYRQSQRGEIIKFHLECKLTRISSRQR